MATAPRTREQAVASALASVTNVPRFCARWTRERFGVAALGDFDGDGAADAEDMWKASQIKHRDDKNPPAGVPVFWGGGSADNGHVAVSLGGGMVRSTDAAGSGRVGTVSIDFPTRKWGMPYLGWTEDLYGHAIVSEQEVRLLTWREKLRAKRSLVSAKLSGIRKRLDALR
jgi:cell wall-associated NlpC family hydrolase